MAQAPKYTKPAGRYANPSHPVLSPAGVVSLFRLFAVLLLASGCTTTPPAPVLPASVTPEQSRCLAFFRAADRTVTEAGVKDGGGAPLADYPWFRSSRFIHAMAEGLDDRALVHALLEQDRRVRLLEFGNLPAARVDALVEGMPDAAAEDALRRCGDLLSRAVRDTDPGLTAVRDQTQVPDDYVTWYRWAGVYPVSRWFIRAGVGVWQRGTRAEFRTGPPDGPAALRYEPVEGTAARSADAVADMVRRAPRDSLGQLQLTETERQMLFAAHAPVIELETDAGHNRIGTPVWEGPSRPNVNVDRPRLYTALGHTRLDGETLPQLHYVFWFSSRPKSHPLDILGGRLDGMTLRITLDNAGRPLLLESMHNCGCYHQHYPLAGLVPRDPADYAEPPLMLPSPGAPRPGERLVVRLLDGSHYLRGLYRDDRRQAGARHYALDDYDALRSLSRAGQRRSLFDPDGLIPGTRRDERFLFWVSGVPSPGAMRQLGRHPTAFVGRRHLDDPELLDRIFRRNDSGGATLQNLRD